MAVLNKRAIVTAIEMYGVTAIRLGRTLNPALAVLIKALFTSGEQGFAYDPNDLYTMWQDEAKFLPVTGAGQPVWHILDKSGNNNHAFATSSTTRPILQRNATTGAYYLAFDGADDSLQTNSIDFTATAKVSLFAGIRKLSDATVSIVAQFGSSFSSVGGFSFYTPTSVNAQSVGFRVNGTTPYAKGITGLASPRSLVFSGQGDIAAQRISARVDGVERLNEAATVGTGNFGNYSLDVGRLSGAGSPFNGHLYSLIGIGRLTSISETTALEKSIAKNTGVLLSV